MVFESIVMPALNLIVCILGLWKQQMLYKLIIKTHRSIDNFNSDVLLLIDGVEVLISHACHVQKHIIVPQSDMNLLAEYWSEFFTV